MNGKIGYLKVALDKMTKKGKPYVSLLILGNAEDEDGIWMSLSTNTGWRTMDDPTNDIRDYADKDDPTKVVYVAEKRGTL